MIRGSSIAAATAVQARAWAALAGFLVALNVGLATLPPAPAQAQTEFACTQIIGYSTTSTWFSSAEAQLENGRWQLLWNNGGSAWVWADPSYAGWANDLVSPCTQNSRSPDRVVMDVATNFYTTNVSRLETDVRNVIATIRLKYPSVRQIMLQPEHGGPDHQTCPWSGAQFGVVRATYNHPAIEAAIARVVGGDIVRGPDPLVRVCSDFADSIGHLTNDGARTLGASNGRFYASISPTPPDPAPTTSDPTPTAPTVTVAPLPSDGRGSLSLNGAGAYAEAPDAPELSSSGDWTVEAWFKDDNPGGFNHPRARIITKGDTSSAEVPFFVDIWMNHLWVGRRIANASQVISFDLGAGGVSADAWHHVAATFDTAVARLTLFLDGVQVAQGTFGGDSQGNTLPLSFGRNGGSEPSFWLGKLDEVRVWNVVRSRSEIESARTGELTGDQPGLVGYWRFNEAVGVTAADAAGTSQDAALLGGAEWSSDSPAIPGPPAEPERPLVAGTTAYQRMPESTISSSASK